MRSLSKPWTLVAGLSALLALSFGLLAWILYDRTERGVVKTHSQGQQLLAQLAATALAHRIDARLHSAESLAAGWRNIPPERLPQALAQLPPDQAANALLVLADGSIRFGEPIGDAGAVEQAMLPWLGSSAPTLTNPFRSGSGEAQVILLAPIRTDGKIVAQVGARFPFDSLVATLFVGKAAAERLSVSLLDEDGLVLANTHHPEMVGRRVPAAEGRCLPCHTSFAIEHRMVRGESDVVSVEIGEGRRSLLAFTPISVLGRRWSLALSEPYANVIADTRRGFRAISFLLAFSLLGGIVATTLIIQSRARHRRAEERVALAESRAALERQLLHNQQLAAMGKMTSQIAHEINTPLAALGLNVSYLQTEVRRRLGETLPEIDEVSHAIAEEIDRLKRVVNDYLRFARLPQPTLAPASVRDAVESYMEFLEAEAHDRGVRLEAALQSGPALALLDGDLFRQAFSNLVRNAFEAMPAGGALRVELNSTEDDVVLSLTDSGNGIPPEVLPHIFDPFFTTKKEGTGLGLAHVRRVIEQHGGRVDCRSTPGQGTTFTICLPALPAADHKLEDFSLAEKGR